MPENWLIVLFTSLIGLIVGSFYNVVGLRMLSGEGVNFPPSHCTKCNHRLNMLDLFPVFSWLFLGGKCRYCKESISRIYPFGELLTAFSFGIIAYKYGWNLNGLVHFVFLSVMIIATITDLKEKIVPDRIVIVGLILVFILRLFIFEGIVGFLVSGVASFALLFAIFILSFGRMGGADVKLYALIGLSVGFSNAVASLFYASLLSILYYLPKVLKKDWNRDNEIPFVPFITLAVLITYFINVYNFLPS